MNKNLKQVTSEYKKNLCFKMMRTMTMGHMNPQNYTYIQQPQQQQQQIPLNHLNIHHGKRPIAPAPVQNILSQNNNNNNMIIKNKKINYAQVQQYHGTQPASVARRNARERNRVKQVNNGFSVLRQRIPQNVIAEFSNGGRGASKKLSKVDTLRMAVSYIKRLQTELQLDTDHDTSSDLSTISSQSSSSYDLDSTENNYFLPASSEASSSPTPSFESETSIQNNNIYAQHEQYNDYGTIYKTEEDILLDTITMWQQQQ